MRAAAMSPTRSVQRETCTVGKQPAPRLAKTCLIRQSCGLPALMVIDWQGVDVCRTVSGGRDKARDRRPYRQDPKSL